MKSFKEFIEEASDETDIGEKTGQAVPRKKMSPAKRHEMEKEEEKISRKNQVKLEMEN